MVKMINKLFGTEMYVHEDRVDEYLEAGHKLASEPSKAPKTAEKPKRELQKRNEVLKNGLRNNG